LLTRGVFTGLLLSKIKKKTIAWSTRETNYFLFASRKKLASDIVAGAGLARLHARRLESLPK
jgi:hypothetical protein